MSVITTINPSTGKALYDIPETSPESLEVVLKVGVDAGKKWHKDFDLSARKKIVSNVLDRLAEETSLIEKLGKEVAEQMGRPIKFTFTEIKTAALRGRFLVNTADEALATVSIEDNAQFKKYLTHEPVGGVVLIIFPWNYPYLCLINSLVPALLAGNPVVIKPSPQTPLVADRILELFTDAGLPVGVLQIFQAGSPQAIEAAIQRPEIGAVAFTGSVAGGLAVQKAASDRTIPVALELGGNDPAYVRGDIQDYASLAENIVDGCIFNSGQSCCAIERVYVHEGVYEQVVQAIVAEVKKYKLGDPMDPDTTIGPVVSVASAKKIRRVINDAVANGAKALIDKEVFAKAESTYEGFVGPQVLVNIDPLAEVLQDETFGPVIPIVKVFSDDEAIKLMNDSEYGLTASVWSNDIEKAEKIANQINAGTVFVNRADYPDPALAWTGWKNSGRGVTLSKYGFEFFQKVQSHHIKKVTF